jgi:hypothetical protein
MNETYISKTIEIGGTIIIIIVLLRKMNSIEWRREKDHAFDCGSVKTTLFQSRVSPFSTTVCFEWWIAKR